MLVTADLASCAAGPSRVRALGRNHLLWSILVKDLALDENALASGLKSQLIELGLWSMRYSTLAMLKDLSLEPLIEVNRNILDGLQSQTLPAARHPARPLAPFAV
jgi:flagellar protein FlaF